MKAYELRRTGDRQDWVKVERPTPQPGPGEVLVRMRAVSLNYRDVLVKRGQYGAAPGGTRPIVPTSDGAGEVVAVGAGVTRVKPGDRVMPTFFQNWTDGESPPRPELRALGAGDVDGVLAEFVVAGAEALVPVPAHLSFEEAATLPCAALTVWHALFAQGGLKAGQTVLVQGTGGVSIFALQFAHHAGARVLATSSQDAKLERARQLGADELFNYKKTPNWEEPVLARTGGQGVDHVLEVGGVETFPHSVRATRAGGHIALIGLLSGSWAQVDPKLSEAKNLRVRNIFVGSRAMFEDMNRFLTQHRIQPVVDRVFPFDQAPEALAHMEAGAHFGKIVVTV
ncbi:zinc-dependent alcohol dehydrogenase family protein [Archangium primigenium]|uniref:zinc-dependent alcohol dehydrogenase family protein n=1 Tax=[Archangium] primigenium TaxID=2792470 RepID=UPI00195B7A46|nr:NAD(P)-dependent alcohol dehydrogenase [Archangium primigenium]MBM7116387.1 NAD(P)-dependent alcohol dehydrogenase [Archangium primigenium]